MFVQMEAGIEEESPLVKAVVKCAEDLGLKPEVRGSQGATTNVVEVALKDGDVRARSIPEHVFRLPGVQLVRRVTPSEVSLRANGHSNHRIVLGDGVAIGADEPCQLIVGPCTVDRHTPELVSRLVCEHGDLLIRGGCWKPRSSAFSFPGFGKKAVRWLLEAARDNGVAAVFIEVIDKTHLYAIRQIRDKVGYRGKIVVWVGARTENVNLLRELGLQREFPVMLKNPINGRLAEWIKRAEFVIAGEQCYDDDGRLIPEQSCVQGNDQLMFCSRGVETNDEESVYRFDPRHECITTMRQRYWPPIGVDPSHSAGTMQGDLVLRNLESALIQRPAFVLLEVYFDDRKPLCDAAQAVPLSRLGEVRAMINDHNRARHGTL